MSAVVLTQAQQLVFNGLIEGKNNKEIGKATGTSEKTVKAHVTHILKKYGCNSRYQVMAKHHRGEL